RHTPYQSKRYVRSASHLNSQISEKNKRKGKMGLQEEFEEYAEKAKTLPESTTNENKLILYGLYKQATVGPVNTS
ncbi:hypothetical protein CISIN_1g043909mg, partial [Citrus sinensis]